VGVCVWVCGCGCVWVWVCVGMCVGVGVGVDVCLCGCGCVCLWVWLEVRENVVQNEPYLKHVQFLAGTVMSSILYFTLLYFLEQEEIWDYEIAMISVHVL
jgi:hypothetical protein